MAGRARARSAERGQAATETMMLTWIVLLFFAAAYQIFMVNETLYRSMTTVHAKMFSLAFEHNCYEDEDRCRFNVDGHAQPIWREQDFPEVRIPTIQMFVRFGLPAKLLIESNQFPPEPSKGCPRPCKRTRTGAGTYYPIMNCVFSFGGCLPGN